MALSFDSKIDRVDQTTLRWGLIVVGDDEDRLWRYLRVELNPDLRHSVHDDPLVLIRCDNRPVLQPSGVIKTSANPDVDN